MEAVSAESLPIPVLKKEDLTFRQIVSEDFSIDSGIILNVGGVHSAEIE